MKESQGNASALSSGAVPHVSLTDRITWFYLPSLKVGRQCVRISGKEPIEPVKLPVQALNQMPGFTSAREIVVFAGKHHNLGCHAKVS